MSLSPDARALLEATKDAHEPSAGDEARILAALSAQVGAGAAAASHPVAAKGARLAVGSKLLAGAVFLAAIGGGSLLLWPRAPIVVVASPSIGPAPAVPASVPPSAAAEAPVPSAAAAPAPSAAAAPVPSTAASPAPSAAASPAPSAAPLSRSAPPAAADPLAAELSLLESAKQALLEHQPARALDLTALHQRRFAKGMLLEEATAVRIQALCEVGRDKESAALRAQFLSRWPRSTQNPLLCPLGE